VLAIFAEGWKIKSQFYYKKKSANDVWDFFFSSLSIKQN
jgi:hypothetical protein